MGRLTRDPEVRWTQQNSSQEQMCIARYTLAVDRRTKDGGADFPQVVAFGRAAEFAEKYFHKGDGITVEGRLESDKYQDKDGNNRVSWRVTVDEVEFPLGKRSEQNNYSQPSVEVGNMVPVEEIGEETDNGDLPF